MNRLLHGLGLLAFLALVLVCRLSNCPDTVHEWGISFVDADCFSRMERVQAIEEGEGPIIRWHAFENHPDGVSPHATAPLDYLILGLRFVLGPFSEQPRDLAGLWISPLLALAGGVLLYFATLTCRFQWQLLVLYAASPALVHATDLGRPDHQSLLLFLLLAAWLAEWRFLREPRLLWGVAAGTAWGLALWTSLFEPLILWIATALALLVFARPSLCQPVRIWQAATTGGIMVLALAIEGIRVTPPGLDDPGVFIRWAAGIGELQPATPGFMHAAMGWLFFPALALAIWSWTRERRPELLIWMALFVLVAALTFWQIRWSTYLPLWFALGLPLIWAPFKRAWIPWGVFVIALWPILEEWEDRLFPTGPRKELREERRMEAGLLKDAATFLATQPEGGFLAAWWVSPALSYWSGQPGVAGSSHQSLPGTVSAAEFWLADDPDEAARILRERQIAYVVTDAPERLIATSESLLDRGSGPQSMARRLAGPRPTPPAFARLLFENAFFRIYEIDSTPKEPASEYPST